MTPEDNVRLTRVGPGTPMGNLMRRYWQPVALSGELPENDGAPIRVRILGEDLIAFRDTEGKIGLVDAFCPHRRAPMFFGRNEECGLRCVYHGWKFDRNGNCVDMPSEPPDSLFKTKVSIPAYPTHEAGGLVWAYLGPPEHQTAPPDYELLRAPDTHRHVSKTYEDCNWLQALEGGIDTSHSSFLHNMNLGDNTYLRNADGAPRLEVERTPYGYTYAGIRPLAFSGKSESKISRKHRVIKEGRTGKIITIAGGKLTTYRNMAKDAVNAACKALNVKAQCITDKKPLPGGLRMGYEDYLKEAVPEFASHYPVPTETIQHLIGLYGSRAERVLELVKSEPTLAETISPESKDMYAQVLFSVREEGARTLSDIILRRLTLGITASRGVGQAEKIAGLAGQELKWSEDEKRHAIEKFKKALNKETACLKT